MRHESAFTQKAERAQGMLCGRQRCARTPPTATLPLSARTLPVGAKDRLPLRVPRLLHLGPEGLKIGEVGGDDGLCGWVAPRNGGGRLKHPSACTRKGSTQGRRSSREAGRQGQWSAVTHNEKGRFVLGEVEAFDLATLQPGAHHCPPPTRVADHCCLAQACGAALLSDDRLLVGANHNL